MKRKGLILSFGFAYIFGLLTVTMVQSHNNSSPNFECMSCHEGDWVRCFTTKHPNEENMIAERKKHINRMTLYIMELK